MKGKIKVSVWMDRMGNISGAPHRKDLRDKIGAHMKKMTGHNTKTFFFQEGGPAEDFMENCSKKQRQNLKQGYDITILVDPWIMAHWYGYDTHPFFE